MVIEDAECLSTDLSQCLIAAHPNRGKIIRIPLIIAGAAVIMALLEMLPVLVWAGSGLLGWIAGDVIATDTAVHPRLQSFFEGAVGVRLDALLAPLGVAPLFVGGNGDELACAALGVIVVLVTGSIWRRQSSRNVAQGTS